MLRVHLGERFWSKPMSCCRYCCSHWLSRWLSSTAAWRCNLSRSAARVDRISGGNRRWVSSCSVVASGRSCLRGMDLDRCARCRPEVLDADTGIDPSAETLGRFNRSCGLLVALAPVAAVLSTDGGVMLRRSWGQLLQDIIVCL